MVKDINIDTIKDYKENSIKEFMDKLIKEFEIEKVNLFTTIDYYKNRYIFNFVCKTSNNIKDDYKIKTDFEKSYGGHYLQVEEISKENREKKGIMSSKVVSLSNNGMMKYKHNIILKNAKRDSKKIRQELRVEFVKVLKDNNLNFKESA